MFSEEEVLKRIKTTVIPFEKAEAALKSAESACESIAVVPINQIRYAFKHLTLALKSQDPEDIEENIRQCNRHCRRAYYDSCDVGFAFFLSEIRQFLDYAHSMSISIIEIDPTYLEWAKIYENAKSFMANSQSIEEKGDRYTIIEQHLVSLEKIHNRLAGLYEEANKKIIKNKALEREKEAAIAAEIAARKSQKRANIIAVISIGVTISIFLAQSLFPEELKNLGQVMKCSVLPCNASGALSGYPG